MSAFEPFGAAHAASVGASAIAVLGLVVLAKRVAGGPSERVYRWTFGGAVLAVNLAWQAWLLTPERYDVRWSLPLQLCDLSWMLAAVCMLCPGDPGDRRHQLLFYWGLGLGTLAFVTPTVTQGVTTISFWRFWITHVQIVGAALANASAFGARPTLRGLRDAWWIGAALLPLVTLLNELLGTNYWFSGSGLPDNPTPVHALGPWPLRLAWMALLPLPVFLLLWSPFRRGAASRASGRSAR